MIEKKDTIRIDTSAQRDLLANGAWLHCSVRGSSLVTGNAALHKAREVAQLVVDLQSVGILESALQLQNVMVENESGVITRSSSARYSLRVRCDELENLANVIGAITTQKNATLHKIEWDYPCDETFYEELLNQCLPKAKGQADLVALGLGVQIIGIHRFEQTLRSPDKSESEYLGDAGIKRARQQSTAPAEKLGLQVSHQKVLTLRVTIEYSISSFESTQTE